MYVNVHTELEARLNELRRLHRVEVKPVADENGWDLDIIPDPQKIGAAKPFATRLWLAKMAAAKNRQTGLRKLVAGLPLTVAHLWWWLLDLSFRARRAVGKAFAGSLVGYWLAFRLARTAHWLVRRQPAELRYASQHRLERGFSRWGVNMAWTESEEAS